MSKGAFGSVAAPPRWLYLALQVLALLVAAAFLVFGIVQAVVALTGDPIALTFPVTVRVPDDDLAGSRGLRLTSASLSQADVMVTGVGPVNRILLALSDLLAAVSIAVIAATVALLCRRLAKGAPFARVCTYAILTSGVALVVGGGGSQLFRGVVRWNVPEYWDGHPIFRYRLLPPHGVWNVACFHSRVGRRRKRSSGWALLPIEGCGRDLSQIAASVPRTGRFCAAVIL